MTTRQVPTEEEIIGYMTSLSNWGRWGPDDQFGTLNLITREKRAEAAGLVREGISLTCGRLIVPDHAPDIHFIPPLHYMIGTGESAPSSGPGGSSDFIGLSYHGLTITHLDSLCHQFWDGKMYNGKPASLVTSRERAQALSIDRALNGIVTRGVLLDIAAVRGKEWLEPGEGVFPEDLDAAEAAQGVRVGEGDALLLRTGWYKKRYKEGPPTVAEGRPGLHAASLPWLHQRGVSLIVADAAHDVDPSGYPTLGVPVHRVGIVAMGLWLLDNANFEDLIEECHKLNRWDCMFVVAALRIRNGTGSPVNPLAIL